MRKVALPLLVTALSVVAGCGVVIHSDLRGVDWVHVAGRDLNCLDQVEKAGDEYLYDITGDGAEEVFVVMHCVTGDAPQPEPDQLEVFDGSSSRANPTRLAVLVHSSAQMTLDDCMYFSGHRAFARGYQGGATTVLVAQWQDGRELRVVERLSQPDAMPSCPAKASD
jgi:hypothetical protein